MGKQRKAAVGGKGSWTQEGAERAGGLSESVTERLLVTAHKLYSGSLVEEHLGKAQATTALPRILEFAIWKARDTGANDKSVWPESVMLGTKINSMLSCSWAPTPGGT